MRWHRPGRQHRPIAGCDVLEAHLDEMHAFLGRALPLVGRLRADGDEQALERVTSLERQLRGLDNRIQTAHAALQARNELGAARALRSALAEATSVTRLLAGPPSAA